VADGKHVARRVLSVLIVVATGLGLYNVFADNSEVKAQAEVLACGKAGCSVKLTREARNPIGQSFEYQVSGSTTPADIDCRRAFYLLGEWQCEKTGGPSAAPSSAGSAAQAPKSH